MAKSIAVESSTTTKEGNMRYTASQVADDIGENKDTILSWVRKNVIKLDNRSEGKRGAIVYFTDRDVHVLRLMSYLRKNHGLKSRKASSIATSLWEKNLLTDDQA